MSNSTPSLESILEANSDVDIPHEIQIASVEEINSHTKMIENEIRVLQIESTSINADKKSISENLKDNLEKIKLNKQLPYLVGNVVEV